MSLDFIHKLLDLKGPDFLAIYVALLFVSCLLAPLIRYLLRPPFGPAGTAQDRAITAEEAAYLSGGPRRAVDAAIAGLFAQGALEVGSTGRRLMATGKAIAIKTPLEKAVIDAASEQGGMIAEDIRSNASTALDDIRARLADDGLLTPMNGLPARIVASVLPALLVALGIAKIVVGLDRHRAVGFLVVLTIIAGIVTLVTLFKKIVRSHRGSAALEASRKANRTLQYANRVGVEKLSSDDVMLAVALYGVASLSSTSYGAIMTPLQPVPRTNTSGSSCSTSSSSCSSSGSSCGGGGGGSGCGGCSS